MAEVASAFVSLMPSAKGFGKKLDGEISGDLSKSGKKGGVSFGKLFAAGAGLALGAKAFSFLGDSLAEATEAAVVGSRTENVIEKMGNAANISAEQVGNLAMALSNKTGIDDEAIQSGQNLLLTFGNIRDEAGKGNDIFSQTSSLMVDMSAAMGTDASGSAIQLGKALNDPVKGITALSRVGVSFTEGQKETIAALVETGDTMGAQKVILGELKRQFGGAAEAMTTPAEKAKVAFGNLQELIGSKLLPVANDVLTFFVDNLPGAIDTATGWFTTIRDAVTDFYDKASKNSVVINAFETIRDVAQSLKDGLGDAVDNAKKIGGALGNIDLGKLDAGDLGKKLGEAMATALENLLSLAGKASESLGKMFAKVDWVGLGISIGKYVPALLLGLAAGILNFDIGNLMRGIGDHWVSVLLGILTIAFAPAKLLAPVTKIISKIPFVGPLIARALTWINELGGKFTKFGGDLVRTFWRGFNKVPLPGSGFISRVLGAIKSLPGKVGDFFSTLQTRIGVWALDAFEAMGKGARTATTNTTRFVGSIPGRILSALGNLARTLFPRGMELLDGMARGIVKKFGEVTTYVNAIPGRIVSAVGNLGSTLYNAGVQLMQGLAAGINAKIQDAINAVQAGLSKIKGMLPGSPIKWGPLKNWNNGGAGKRLMDLVSKGIEKGTPKALSAAEGAFGKIGDALKKTRDGLQGTLEGLKSDFASLADSVAQSFTGDLFGVTATEAVAATGDAAAVAGRTVGQNFIDNLMGKKAGLTSLLTSFKTLQGWGIDPGFLSQLFASGNGGLITELAGMGQTGAMDTASLFGEVNALGAQLGNAVASNDPISDRIDQTNVLLTTVTKQLNYLGSDIGKELNQVAAKAQRDKKNRGKR
ncbi:hypothetical protein [Nocardioides terrigena]|uniref:hypothetical protein n=1 Tax=Nocardioides terrigena TaxID=424797 RepID=UPI00131EE46D|nr:hypothetical protein [Nocardioides terrigena]